MAAAMIATERRRIKPAYVSVVICGKLAFRYDPDRHVVEWQAKGETFYIDLAQIESKAQGIDTQEQ